MNDNEICTIIIIAIKQLNCNNYTYQWHVVEVMLGHQKKQLDPWKSIALKNRCYATLTYHLVISIQAGAQHIQDSKNNAKL